MTKKKSLMPVQQAEIRRMYLQLDDKALASSVGSDPKTVCEYREQNGLVRNQYTEDKLSKRDQENESTGLDKRGGVETPKVVSENLKKGSA